MFYLIEDISRNFFFTFLPTWPKSSAISNLPANICWSSRRLQDMSWRCLQHVFSVTIFRLPRCLEDVLKTFCKYILKTSWKTKNCYAEDVLKTSWRYVLKTSWRHVLKTSWRHVLKTSWRQTKCLLGMSICNKSKCVSNKSIFHKSISDESKANPKCIN